MPPSYTDEGATAARLLKAEHPDLGVLLLSQHIETANAADLVAWPGFGYLLKDRVFEVDEFVGAAERVAAGGSALDPKVVAAMVGSRRGDGRTMGCPTASATCSVSWPRDSPTQVSPTGSR